MVNLEPTGRRSHRTGGNPSWLTSPEDEGANARCSRQGFSRGVFRPLTVGSVVPISSFHARHGEARPLTGPFPQILSRNPPLPVHGVSPTNNDGASAAKVGQEFRQGSPPCDTRSTRNTSAFCSCVEAWSQRPTAIGSMMECASTPTRCSRPSPRFLLLCCAGRASP